jgi:DNA repair exonuclease SbcCD ATPase subunit
MKFPELAIENFLAITNATVNLADRGLMVIQGKNHADTSADSNGAGKSSIPDALSWCWFGVTARGVSGDDVINFDAKKNCLVRSVVQDGHMTYTATRHRKHKTGKNAFTISAYDGIKTTDLTKGTEKLTQEVANQIIGCSLDVFAGSIYAGQEQMPDLPAMTDKNLKVLIEEAAGVTVLEGAYRKAREDHAAAIAVHGTLTTNHAAFLSRKSWFEAEIKSLKDQAANWEKGKDDRVNALRVEVAAVVPQLKQFQVDVAAYDEPALLASIKACDDKIAAVSAENAKLASLENAVAMASANQHAALSTAVSAKKLHDAAKTDLANVSHKVGCPCDSCGRPLTPAELGGATAAAELKLKMYVEGCERAEKDSLDADAALKSAVSARDTFKLSMTDLSAVNAQRASLQSQHASYLALVGKQNVATTLARSLRDKINKAMTETNPYIAQVTKHTDELAKVEKDLDAMLTGIKEQAETVALEAEVVKVFSPAGVRARILDEVTPFLNTQTSKYLSTLSDGNIDATWTTLTPTAKGELREKFTIDVSNDTGGKIFKSLSGGEKRKVRVATALALQDLVATRASKPIDLFIGDEIDDALDPAGLERLTMILEEKARERGSVLVISHNELRDHIKQVMLVEKMPDKTTKVTEMAA